MSAGKSFWVRASGLAFVVVVLGTWVWIEATPVERIAPAADKALTVDKSPAAQRERKAVMDKLIADGLVRRVEGDSTAVRVALRPAFYNLDEPTQRGYVDAIYRYYFDGSNVNDTVSLRDARHGNKIGEYNPYQRGLVLYK